MSVQFDIGLGARARHLFSCFSLCVLAVTGLAPLPIRAQDESATGIGSDAGTSERLWSQVTSRYSVVVLSRGLLLEPLDDAVEMLIIEIVDDSVAIDGEPVDEEELRRRIGEEDAGVVLELAAMDRTQRRLLFEPEEREVGVEEAQVVETGESSVTAEEDGSEDERYRDAQVSVGNSLTVRKGEVAKEALVFGGPLIVEGRVRGDAVAIGGSVTVSGEVTGDVAAVGGNLTLEAGAEVLGDVVSVGGEIDIDDEAKVRGQIIEVPFGPNLRFSAWPGAIFGGHSWRSERDSIDLSPWGVATGFLWEAFKLLVIGLLACLVMLLAREPLHRVKRKAADEPWKSGLVGLLVQILFLPLLVLVTLILVISIIGIPLVLLVPFFVLALILVAFLGYSGVALGLGEFLRRRFDWQVRNEYFVLLIGVVTIQIWSVIADLLDFGWGPLWFFAVMFGITGVLIKYVAWTVGLGAAFLTRFGTAEGWGDRAAVSQPPVVPEQTEVAVPPRSIQPSSTEDPGLSDGQLPTTGSNRRPDDEV